MQQDTTPAQQEVPGGMTEEAAASELLKRWGAADDTPPPKDEPAEDEPEAQPEEGTAQDGEDEDEPSEESDDIEVDVAGEKFKLPKVLAEQAQRIEAKVKEIEAGATRKFQEAADVRKVAESQIEAAKQLKQLSEAEVDLLADRRMVERRLQQLLSIDTTALYESDPAQLARLTAEAQQLQFAQQRIEQSLSNVRAQSQGKVDELDTARFGRLNEYAAKTIKGWSDEYSRTLLEFSVKELGADPEALKRIMAEPVLKALDLAYRGWKVQTAAPLRKQVVATKTLKPGAVGQTSTRAQQTVESANKRLGQTGKVDDAAAALLARMNAKRR